MLYSHSCSGDWEIFEFMPDQQFFFEENRLIKGNFWMKLVKLKQKWEILDKI